MRIVVLGITGVGKSTQVKKICKEFALSRITVGGLLRDEIAEESTVGRHIKLTLDSGGTVADDQVFDLLRKRLSQPEMRKGFVLDSFPKTTGQMQTLESLLIELGMPLQMAIQINIDFEVLMDRLVGRRTCNDCGTLYNIYSTPPVIDGCCDLCGGRLRGRVDDNEDVIGTRLRSFDVISGPVLEFYKKQEIFSTFDGGSTPGMLFSRIRKAIRNLITVQAKLMEDFTAALDSAHAETADIACSAAEEAAQQAEAAKSAAQGADSDPKKKVANKKKVASKKTAAKKTAVKKTPAKKAANKKAGSKKT